MNNLQILEISSYPKNYTVEFADQNEIQKIIKSSNTQVYAIIDSNIKRIYKNYIDNLDLKNILELDVDEKLKTLQGIEKICKWLLESKAKKDSILIGIGGGVIQDVCTFVSHIYYRGIEWIYIPTTLLSQSDSCIGAKCGINFDNFKNQLGVIHAPFKVLIDISFINSLDTLDIYSGLGEILKLSLTGPNQFYEYFIENVAKPNINFKEIIYKSLNAKKPIIEEDEFEKGLRRILNYGHSFGHALEHCLKGEVPHGLAVVWGIDLINYIGNFYGVTTFDLFQDIRINSKKIFKYTLPKNFEIEELFEALTHDKKITNDQINLALLENIGELIIKPINIDLSLKSIVKDYLMSDYVFRPA